MNEILVNDAELRDQQVGQSGMQTRGEFDDMIVEDEEIARGNEVEQVEAMEAKAIPDVPQPSKHGEFT